MSKEEIYDNQINPLMAQIISLCKEHDIPFVTSFQLTGEEDGQGPLFCTSCSLPDGSHEKLSRAVNILYRNSPAFIFIIKETSDDSRDRM